MPRPCECDRFVPGTAFVRGRDCGRCWLWHNRPDGAAARAWKGEAAPARVSLPCVHAGPAAGPKGWHYCEHADTPLGDVVCSCKGCGPRCPGYLAPAPAVAEDKD